LASDPRGSAFATLLAEAPLGIAVLDRDLRYLVVNEQLAAVNGLPAAEHVGRTLHEVVPEVVADVEPALRQVLDAGVAVRGLVLEATTPASPDVRRTFELSFHPLRGEGGRIDGVISLVSERTDEARATEILRSSERRYRSLVEATTSLVWTIVPGGQPHTDWLDAIHPDDQEHIAGEWLAAVAEGRTFEAEARILAGGGIRHVIVRAVPIIEAGDIREWVGASTDITAARRAEGERAAASRRATRLGQVASALTEALREADVATVVLDNAIAALHARGGAVALFQPDGAALRFAAARWPGDHAEHVLRSDLSLDRPIVRAARDRVPVFLSDHEELAAAFPEVADLLATIGDEATASVPLLLQGQSLGALALTWSERRELSAEDRQFLAALGDTCAQAIDRARLYEREHRVAETLQRALLPERLADPAGTRSAARYLPGTEGVAVGGDWYDVFGLGERRIGIVLGDVAGKGVAAAAVMGRLRNALRAYATSIDGPADVLAAVDDFAGRFGTDDLATIVYGVLDTGTGELRYSSAGHLPPLAIRADGLAGYLEGDPDLPVGVAGPAARTEHRVRLSPGSTLVLYSDGLVEDRHRSIEDGLALLAEVAETTQGSGVEATCARLVQALVGDTGGDDDVAVLVLEWDGPPAADRCSAVLPPVVASARRARALVTEQLEHWGEADLAETAQLCVSEIVTNAVVHAATPVELDVRLLADRVRVEVADGGAAPPERVEAHDEDVHGRGIAIVELLSSAWGVDQRDDGKCVWFELTRGDSVPPGSPL
jgi:serine phosphatase RsbU (regulator of sigma subunit)/PAS domain-containing protein/anti-sigma regulatory factor (Ser/Thr protein kinase)